MNLLPLSTLSGALLLCSGAALAAPAAPAAPVPAPVAPPVAAPAPDASAPMEFAEDARLLYRVVACVDGEPLPAHIDAKVVERYCAKMKKRMKIYEETYLGHARTFLNGLRPSGLPTTVVYPFGGGDLITALTTYPDATEITTLSLEYAGDPRRLAKIDRAALTQSLAVVYQTSRGLLPKGNSTTENLQWGTRNDIPGELAFFMLALAAHGFEPVSMRYFTLNDDGTLHYLTAAEIAAMEKKRGKTLRGKWEPPTSSVAFANVEIGFKPRGAGLGAPLRYHRHFAANLADDGFAANPALLKHLQAKGRISAMTKAASYLLWRDHFSTIRKYLVDHMEYMISDSTGVPPSILAKAGFELLTYGKFVSSFLKAPEPVNQEFRALWKSQPERKLDFRYGYIDSSGSPHLFVARRKAASL